MQMDYHISARNILLKGFQINCEIGLHDWEKGNNQRVIIDIDLALAENTISNTDAISSTIDYDFLRIQIAELVKKGRFNLQETLCSEITKICMSDERVVSAEVKTSKPDAYPDCQAVSFQMKAVR